MKITPTSVKALIITVVTIFVLVLSTAEEDAQKSLFVSRQNYGYILKRVGQIQLTTGQARLMFDYKIPEIHNMRPVNRLECRQYRNNTNAKRNCLSFRGLVYSLFQLKNDMVNLLASRWREINELLQDVHEPSRNRERRGLGSWIGSGIAKGFGLATEDDLTEIQSLMGQVLEGAQRAIVSWKNGQSLITKVIKISDERFAHIDQLLNITRLSIMQEYERLDILRQQAQGTHRVLAAVVEELHLSLRSIQQTESLYLAIQSLAQGRLSHHLVHTDQFKEALHGLSVSLQKSQPELELVYRDISYYYTSAEVGGVYYNKNGEKTLVVFVNVPLTNTLLKYPLTIFQVQKFELKSPDNQTYYTVLGPSPEFVAYDLRNPYYLLADNEAGLPFRNYANWLHLVNIHQSQSVNLWSCIDK